MKVSNKKGLTLIELIIAIAILAISMVTISTVLTYSVNSESRSSVNLDTASYAKAIIEISKTQPIGGFTGKPSPYKCYVYFNNMDELRNNLNNSYFGSTSSSDVQITSIGSFNDCAAKNSNSKQYAVCITKTNDTSTDYLENTLFNFDISVWNLKRGSSIVTHREFSISR